MYQYPYVLTDHVLDSVRTPGRVDVLMSSFGSVGREKENELAGESNNIDWCVIVVKSVSPRAGWERGGWATSSWHGTAKSVADTPTPSSAPHFGTTVLQ